MSEQRLSAHQTCEPGISALADSPSRRLNLAHIPDGPTQSGRQYTRLTIVDFEALVDNEQDRSHPAPRVNVTIEAILFEVGERADENDFRVLRGELQARYHVEIAEPAKWTSESAALFFDELTDEQLEDYADYVGVEWA